MAEQGTRASGVSRAHPATQLTPSSQAADGALERLERLLHLLPAAARDGGAKLSELAEQLDVEPGVLLDDIQMIWDRSYSLPGGSQDITLTIDGERICAWTSGEFRRPVRLKTREALALGLGLRMAALRPSGDGAEREALRARLERHLATGSAESLLPQFAAPDLAPDPEAIRERLARAMQTRQPCSISYLKPETGAPEERRIHPYRVAHAEGRWYVIAFCELAEAVRVFRTDRILEASPHDAPFREEAGFDPEAFLGVGRVFRGEADTEATVRYSPHIARWIAERESGEWSDEGAFVVRHPVADASWLVRLVLQHGGAAEVVEPPELRAVVEEAARRVLTTHR